MCLHLNDCSLKEVSPQLTLPWLICTHHTPSEHFLVQGRQRNTGKKCGQS